MLSSGLAIGEPSAGVTASAKAAASDGKGQ